MTASNTQTDRPKDEDIKVVATDAVLEAQSLPSSEEHPEEAPYSIYKPWQKRCIVAGAAVCAFYNPLTAQVYMPALNVLSKEFAVTPAEINLTVTTYMVFQGVTPIIFSGFADRLGRRPGYIACLVVYIAANIALAVAHEYKHMLIVRCLQSAGSATIMVLCQAAVADIVTSAERGQYIGITAIPSILGPSTGPVIGGALTKFLGWRSIFWFLTICAGVNFILLVTFLPETCRKIVGDGSVKPPALYLTLWQAMRPHRFADQHPETLEEDPADKEGKLSMATKTLLSSVRLLRDLELVLLVLSGGIVFSGVYAIATAAPHIFSTLYGLDDFEVGLMYLPIAGGSIVAVACVGPGMNWNYRRHAKKLGIEFDKSRKMDISNFPIEKVRLQVAIPLLLLGVGVTLSWGWITANRADIEEVCALVFFIGISLVGVNNAIQALIIDLYADKAGAALAAYNLAKCLLGAGASAIIDPLINEVGIAYAFTVFGGLYLVLVPVLYFVMWKGPQWRKGRSQSPQQVSSTDDDP